MADYVADAPEDVVDLRRGSPDGRPSFRGELVQDGLSSGTLVAHLSPLGVGSDSGPTFRSRKASYANQDRSPKVLKRLTGVGAKPTVYPWRASAELRPRTTLEAE